MKNWFKGFVGLLTQSLTPWRTHSERERLASSFDLPVRVGEHELHTGAFPYLRRIDAWLISIVISLLLFGLVMVYSASIALPENPKFNAYSHTHFLWRHLWALGLGAVGAWLVFQIPMAQWERLSPWLFIVSLLLLIAVLLPHIGKGVNGARRWISLGLMNFQPSELAKLAVLLYGAGYMVRKTQVKESFVRAVLPMVSAVGIMGLLLLAEPDMGAFLVIATIAVGILFLGGVNMRMLILIGLVMLVSFGLMVMLSPWRRDRIFAYLDPWDEKYTLGRGYQLSHSLIAFGRGEWFGVGLGGSVEKLHWLPEAHTDFLLAVIGEELGLAGVLLVMLLFFWLARRCIQIGRQAIALDQVFSGLTAQGVGIWMGFQALINMGVNLGALPTKGLTLPLMSYGGSAILMNLVALAIVLRVDYENHQLMQKGVQ
jgi:cell division protein FtsW